MAIIRDTDRGRLLTRRAFVIGGTQIGLYALLLGRLYELQIKEGQKYQMMAEENRISMRVVIPPRGIILDRNGVTIAHSQKSFRADLAVDQTSDAKETLKQLYGLMPFEEWEKRRIEKDLKKNRNLLPILLRDNLSWDDLALLELHTPDLSGVVIEAGEARHYPFNAATAHILGYIGAPSEDEAGDDPLLNQPGFRIGKSGIERHYDEALRGKPGNLQLEVNAYGRAVRELNRTEGTPGHEVKLTLDIKLQEFAQARLTSEQSAAAVVMDAVDGSLYAMASHPSFDPNLFTYGISKDNWTKLNNDPLVPLMNKTVMGLYAPGSTFKIVAALAALEAGVNPKKTYHCSGALGFGNHTFHCWKKGGHGTVDMKRGMIQSCDVYFYHVGQDAGIDRMTDVARRMGLGEKLGIDLPQEKDGLIPSRAWKKKRFKENWQAGETLVATIGQGYMLTTPLQLAVMTARVASGAAVKPHLMQSVRDVVKAQEKFPPLQVNPDHLEFVRQAMIGVCAAGGTAYGARIDVPGYEMGGKTGTSQVRRISKAERAKGVIPNEKRPWEERDHALFVGFAPAKNPRYVCAVVVEHGGGGSKAAAPIARDLLMELMRSDPAKVLERPLPPAEKTDAVKTPDNTPDDKRKKKTAPTPDGPDEEDTSLPDDVDFNDFGDAPEL